MDSLSLLQGIFPTQGSNPGLPHCRQILFQLSHQGIPRILEWVAYPFSSRSSWLRNWTGVSCIAGGFFTNRDIREALGNDMCHDNSSEHIRSTESVCILSASPSNGAYDQRSLRASTSYLNSIALHAVFQWTPSSTSSEGLTFRMLEPQLMIILLKTSSSFRALRGQRETPSPKSWLTLLSNLSQLSYPFNQSLFNSTLAMSLSLVSSFLFSSSPLSLF